MKDLPLSLLSRGCGRFVSSKGNTGGHDGRLDVCFTPQDYYIWKSQDSLLRLSNSGRLLVEAESALPKTYSTRRGPLLLYSQDLVSMETSCRSEIRDRKQRVVRQYPRQVGQQLSTVKELSAAILSYSNTQFPTSRLSALFFPPLHPPLAPDLHRLNPPRPEQLAHLNPQWLPAERSNAQLENQPADKEEEQDSRKRVRLDLFLQIPSTSRTPTPQMEPQPWIHYVAVTPEKQEGPQTCVDIGLQHTEISMGGELHHPGMNEDRDVADDQGCCLQDTGMTTSDEGNYERSTSGNRRGRTGLLPPLTVRYPNCDAPCWEKTDRLRWEGPGSDEHHARCLPPIAEGHTVPPSWGIQAQQEARPKAERVGFQSQENLNRLRQQPRFLPLLFPGKEEEISGQQRRGGGKTERQCHEKETVGQGCEGGGGGGALPSMILLEPGEEPPPPGGALGWVAGRKGPGKQSSFAFLQNLQDPRGPSDANRGAVRGVLPLELRDLQNGESVGSLILGPDGEIIQLSLYDSPGPPHADGGTRDRALQVLSADGEKLPWVIVLQPEHTHAEGEVELPSDVPVGVIQHRRSVHELLDLPRPKETDACSASSSTGPAAVTEDKAKGAGAVSKKWVKGAKNLTRMPPLRERVGSEEQRGGSTEEEEDEGEEPSSTGQRGHDETPRVTTGFKDLDSSQQDFSPNGAPAEGAEDKGRKDTKRKDVEEAATSTGKREMRTGRSAAPDGRKASRTKGEGRRPKAGSGTQPVGRREAERRPDREAANPPVVSLMFVIHKRTKEREGEKGRVKTKEERDERRGAGGAKEEEPAGTKKRRRGRPTPEELAVGSPEDPLKKEEVDISQEGSDMRTTKRPSATQSHRGDAKTPSDDDPERLSKHSSVQSVSSLRSAAGLHQRGSRRSTASSCEGGAAPASAPGVASSRGRLSSCSTVMVTEEQLTLNPVKPEFNRPRRTREEEEEAAAALRLAERAERRRQEVERKRREREEEERKRQQREQTEEKMKSELEEERRKRAEDLRMKKLAEEQEWRRREEEEQERGRREQALREKERRRQEERRRQTERLQKMREEDEQRREAELERLRLEEERREEEEREKLQEMDEGERIEYLCRKELEEEKRRNEEEERKRREEEAAEEARLQTELLDRQVALLQQQLAFKRGLVSEAGGLEKAQGISRPWIYSYFTLLQLLGLNPTKGLT
ncbi:uncharacterized protein KIAA2012 homolog [Cyclopterus lumpus]|uniref:uncharacterized protein KIAA2012 homolog n=1 Tax=Cyclopterus lumpus TaxID=8103 RepID=UPI001486B9C4|nr:uncharacterized protein KIAA2012 homolog [Cyclopterus lumpus]